MSVLGSLKKLEGWEHGVLSTGGAFIADSITANAGSTLTVDSSQAATGTYSLKGTQTNASGQSCYIFFTNVVDVGFFSGTFKFRKSGNPTSRVKFWDCYYPGEAVYLALYLETNGSLTLEWNTNSTQTSVNTQGALANDTWHSVQIGADTSGTAWVAYLVVNGSAAVNNCTSTQSSPDLTGSMAIGANTEFFGGAKGTWNMWLDDIVFTNEIGDHPLGPLSVKGYSLNGVGTHNLDASPSAHYFKHDNTTETALTSSETTSHQMIDEIPFLTAVGDRVQVKAVVSAPSLPTFVSAGTVNSGAAGVAPGVPASTADGDILIITVESENETACTLSGGNQTWTEVGAVAGGAGTGTGSATDATRIQAFWARRGATTPTMPTTSDTGDHQQVRCTAWRNCYSQGSPIGSVATSTEATNTDTTGSASGFTTITPNEMVLLAVGTALPDTADTGAQFTGWTNANLGSVTERTDNTTNAGTGGGMGLCSGTMVTAGSTGSTTFTTAQSTAKAMLMFSLKGAVTITQPSNTKYVEYTLADSAESVAPFCAAAMVALNTEGVGNPQIGVYLRSASVDGQVFNTTFFTGSSINFYGVFFPLTPAGAEWTDALFDALTVRAGFTSNVTDAVHLENFMVQAAFPAASGGTLTPIAISAGLTLTPAITKQLIHPVSVPASLTLTAAMTQRMTRLRTLSAGLTLTAALGKLNLRPVARTLTLTAALVRAKLITVPGAIVLTAAMTLLKKYQISVPASLTLTGAITRRLTRIQALTAGLTLTPAIATKMTAYKAIVASLVASPVMNRKLFKVLSVNMALTPAITFGRFYLRTLPAGLTLTGALTFVKVKLVSIPGATTLTAVIVRKPLKAISNTLTLTAALTRGRFIALSAGLTLTLVIAKKLLKFLTVPVSLVLTGALTFIRILPRAISAGVTLTPILNRRLNKTLAVTNTLTPTVTPVSGGFKLLAATLTLTPTITKKVTAYKALSASLTATAQIQLIRITYISLSGNAPLTVALSRRLNRTLNQVVNLTGAMTVSKLAGAKTLPVTLTLTLALVKVKTIPKALSAALVLDGVLNRLKVAPRALAASLTLTVALIRQRNVPFAVTLATNPVLVKLKMKFVTVAANLVLTPVVTKMKSSTRLLAVTTTLAVVLSRLNMKLLARNLTLSVVVTKKVLKRLDVSLPLQLLIDRVGDNISLDVLVTMNATLQKALVRKVDVTVQLSPLLKFSSIVMRFRDWLLSTKMDEAVLDSAEIQEPELLAATYVGEE